MQERLRKEIERRESVSLDSNDDEEEEEDKPGGDGMLDIRREKESFGDVEERRTEAAGQAGVS